MQATTETLKYAFILLIFLLTMLAGLAPIQTKSCRENAKILGIMNTFSGGVFLAIAFVHILPETANLYYGNKLRAYATKHLPHLVSHEHIELGYVVQELAKNELLT